jgi:hypothetical protein
MKNLLLRLLRFALTKVGDTDPVVLDLHDAPWSLELRELTAQSQFGKVPILGFPNFKPSVKPGISVRRTR